MSAKTDTKYVQLVAFTAVMSMFGAKRILVNVSGMDTDKEGFLSIAARAMILLLGLAIYREFIGRRPKND